MHREKVNRRVVVKNTLSAVAVVNIPVDDRDVFDLLILVLSVAGGDGDIVEQAKAHGVLRRSMMPRRPDRDERIGGLAVHDGVNRAASPAGAEQSGVE